MTVPRVVLPAPDPPSPAPRVPVLALVAPAVAAVVIWAVTGQVLALVFAALGPVTMLASVADQWWGARRSARLARRRFDDRLAAARERVAREHEREREERQLAVPDGPAIAAFERDAGLWRPSTTSVTVGSGRVASRVEADAPADVPADLAAAVEEVVGRARVLDGPVEVDPAEGIGVTGSPLLARACARGLVLQCARRFGPDEALIDAAGPAEGWIARLPHSRGADAAAPDGALLVRFRSRTDGAVLASVAVAETSAALPAGCSHVLEVGDGGARLVSAARTEPVRPAPLALAAADGWAGRVADVAGSAQAPPRAVALGSLLGATSGLACAFAADARGPFPVDLLEHGPHAVVAGTTGSGKSELLVSWVVALAAGNSPSALSFLLVDFKGGAAFLPLAELPHVVGIVTDLDAEQAERALTSLRAELRRRERALAEPGAAVGAGDVPRLVIVVDEFAAMIEAHPDLHALMTDLAARGRSLGMHLVLCTQRPTGVVRDALLANADLRISLRVNNAGDSRAVLDDPGAAAIESRHRGRVLIRRAGEAPVLAQVARTTSSDIAAVAQQWAHAAPPPRPWRERLPALVTMNDLDGDAPGVRFGLSDLPAEQRWGTAVWRPETDGALLVVGAPRSGRTTALAAMGAQFIGADPDVAWDDLTEVLSSLDAAAASPALVGIDDLDTVLARLDPEHRAAALEMIARLLREGPAAGIHVAVSARRLAGELSGLASLLPAVLRLRHASRHEWLLAGGEGDALVAGAPGAARWRGDRVQIAHVAPPTPTRRTPAFGVLDPARPLAVVLGAPAARAAFSTWSVVDLDVAHAGQLAPGQAAAGEVDEWQARFGLLARLREQAEVVFAACTTAEVRAVTRSRILPPPLAPGSGGAWRWRPDGNFDRVRPAAG